MNPALPPLAAWANFYMIVGSAAAFGLAPANAWSPFAMAATTLFLLFIGIHNAWDAVAWNAVQRTERERPDAAA